MSATGKAAQIADALLARANLLQVGAPNLPIAMPDVDFDPPAGPYLEVGYFPTGKRWRGVAGGKVDQGRLVIGIVWPKGQGVIKAAEIGQQVVDHFPPGLRLRSGDTTVKIEEDADVGSPINLPDRTITAVTILWVA